MPSRAANPNGIGRDRTIHPHPSMGGSRPEAGRAGIECAFSLGGGGMATAWPVALTDDVSVAAVSRAHPQSLDGAWGPRLWLWLSDLPVMPKGWD